MVSDFFFIFFLVVFFFFFFFFFLVGGEIWGHFTRSLYFMFRTYDVILYISIVSFSICCIYPEVN